MSVDLTTKHNLYMYIHMRMAKLLIKAHYMQLVNCSFSAALLEQLATHTDTLTG